MTTVLSPCAERRVYPRTRRNRSSILITVGPANVVVGQVYDLSTGGIGILSSHHLTPGEMIEIYVPAYENHPCDYIKAEVRHTTIHPNGLWLLGCALRRPMTGVQVSALR